MIDVTSLLMNDKHSFVESFVMLCYGYFLPHPTFVFLVEIRLCKGPYNRLCSIITISVVKISIFFIMFKVILYSYLILKKMKERIIDS